MKRITAILFIATIFLSACATARWVNSPVLDKKNIKVSLEYRQENGEITRQNFNHPLVMDPGELERLLSELAYAEKVGMVEGMFKDQKPAPVFQADEAAGLAPAIADALAKATSDERVRFTSINRGGGVIFASRRITDGIIFAESPDRLNIAFNVINYELLSDQPDELPSDFKYNDPLKNKYSWTVLVPTSAYAHLHQLDTGKNSPMWIIVDLNQFKAMPRTAPQPVAEKKGIESGPASSVETKGIDAGGSHEQPASPATDKNTAIKNRLELLKELYEKNLITEPEYDAKKKEILNEIK